MRATPLSATALICLLLAPFTHAAAPPDDGWHHVEQLAPGTHIHISADGGGATCKLRSADESTLSCDGRHGKVFERSVVRAVKLTRYGVSTAAGAGIGAGVGGLLGIGTGGSSTDKEFDFTGAVRVGLVIVGGLAGAAICGPTDTFRGPTVYKRAVDRTPVAQSPAPTH